jgi:predicted nuclease of predicted toxin-antitoxin system
VHAAEVGPGEADDADILAWAAAERRIVITRNYSDFAPLAQMYARHGRGFPGVLFLATSIRQSDVGHHVSALHRWLRSARESGANPVENGIGWLC